jgi:CDP-diacylglycerol--glycerol-3-phosphate 3-phosphatidyltransferase
MKRHIPNVLTIGRVVLCFVNFAALGAIAFLANAHPQGPDEAQLLELFLRILAWVAVGSFVVAAVTDFFDGWLARRWGVVSLTGAILDPIADKILVCGAILGLMAVGTPGVMVSGGLILFREFAVSALREVLAPRGIKLPVTFLAKTKTALQLFSLGGLMVLTFWPAWHIDAPIAALIKALQAFEILFALTAMITLWTGLEYALAARKALKAEASQ